ncbi:MAG: hypothetical protein H7122_16685 [Chitinophagaceae bacterium]|nr:hypothetical protein [Chitinophagaceae bacterium]
MTIAYDPKPSVQQAPVNRYEMPGPREITDENMHHDEPDEIGIPDATDEDWLKMYRGKKMEENY